MPFRSDDVLPTDVAVRESTAVTLAAVLKPGDSGPGAVAMPSTNSSGTARFSDNGGGWADALRRKSELKLTVELSPTRMRAVLGGSGWVLPSDTEVRARADRFGHVVFWPGQRAYRPIAPGTLRALLGEGRLDAAPIAVADLVARDDAGSRLGLRTRKVDVVSRAARAAFEIAAVPDLSLGSGGTLLCRFLLDLMNASPSVAICTENEVPLRADFRWLGGGALTFEVTRVTRTPRLTRADSVVSALAVPPPGAEFLTAPLSLVRPKLALSASDLAAFRPAGVDAASGHGAHGAGVSGDGLVVINSTDQVRGLFVDSVLVAWLPPGAVEIVRGLPRGRYAMQSRAFLGDSLEAAELRTVPGQVQLGQGVMTNR